ncbi:MAG: alternative ribosome rescue factor ArfA [Alphaproteobacteria bacterium]
MARALRTPTFRQRKVRPKKGRGSYSRANRTSVSFIPFELKLGQ